MFTVIWKYEVNSPFSSAFEELYGQNGKWVQLFKGENLTTSETKIGWFGQIWEPFFIDETQMPPNP